MSNLEDQILTNIAKKMQEDIDVNVLWTLLEQQGWTRVKLSRFIDRKHSVDIVNWLRENVDSPYEKLGCDFIFRNEKDAVHFILRWV